MDACFRSEDTALANLPERDKTSLLSGVLTYISEHFTEKITLEEAGAVAYRSGFSSTSFFNHVFKEQYHMSPFAYRSRFGVARNRKGESEDPPKL